MKRWKISALELGTNVLDKAVATYLTDCGVELTIYNIAFLLSEEGGRRRILVDTGFSSADEANRVTGERCMRTPEQELNKQLDSHGCGIRDVDTVILTHLHFDHCGNAPRFTRAKIYVQRKELQYSFAPLPGEEVPYFSPLIGETPPFLGADLQIIDGDMEIDDGVEVVLAPGHTPGGQMVFVHTSEGTACITGDNAFLFENIEKNIPCGHVYSRADWFASMERARRRAACFLPGHDKKVLELYG
jgi:glyoxylase-like metal-dependent hydrolase (beta-lactamase superfamily II)